MYAPEDDNTEEIDPAEEEIEWENQRQGKTTLAARPMGDILANRAQQILESVDRYPGDNLYNRVNSHYKPGDVRFNIRRAHQDLFIVHDLLRGSTMYMPSASFRDHEFSPSLEYGIRCASRDHVDISYHWMNQEHLTMGPVSESAILRELQAGRPYLMEMDVPYNRRHEVTYSVKVNPLDSEEFLIRDNLRGFVTLVDRDNLERPGFNLAHYYQNELIREWFGEFTNPGDTLWDPAPTGNDAADNQAPVTDTVGMNKPCVEADVNPENKDGRNPSDKSTSDIVDETPQSINKLDLETGATVFRLDPAGPQRLRVRFAKSKFTVFKLPEEVYQPSSAMLPK